MNHTVSKLGQTVLLHHFCPLSKTEGTALCQPGVLCSPPLQGLRYVPAGCFLAVQQRREQHWEIMSGRGLQIRKCQLLFPSKPHSARSLPVPGATCHNMGTLHYTAQEGSTEEGVWGLILPMLFWWVTRKSGTSHCWRSPSSSLPLLQGRTKEKMIMWRTSITCNNSNLYVYLQTNHEVRAHRLHPVLKNSVFLSRWKVLSLQKN